MSKRNKQRASGPAPGKPTGRESALSPSVARAITHSPAKQPTLLAVSIILFALWFVFLLVTALTG